MTHAQRMWVRTCCGDPPIKPRLRVDEVVGASLLAPADPSGAGRLLLGS